MKRAEWVAKWLVCWLALAMAGCGLTALDRARVAGTSAADTGLAVGKFVSTLNEQKEAEIAGQVEVTGDAAKARAERDKWRKRYDGAEQAVKTYGAGVSAIRAGIELSAIAKNLDLGKALAELLKLGRSLKAALESFGIEMPGGGLL